MNKTKALSSLVLISVFSIALGVTVGNSISFAQDQETNYLVMEKFVIAPNQTPAEAIERLSTYVRALRATGDHSSVRLFFHDWGPEVAVYLISETTDWSAVGNIFNEVLAVDTDFMNQPFGFAGHSDNIMTEISVQ